MPRWSDLVPPSALTWPARLARLAVSWMLISVSVAMMIQADVGAAPIDCLITGLSDTTGWDFGLTFILVSVVFYGFGAVLGSWPGLASVGGTFVIGPAVAFLRNVIGAPEALSVRIPLYAGGVVVVAAGICLAVSTDLGPGPSEVAMLGLHRHGVSLVAARWAIDGSHIVAGLLLRGPVGVGTAVFLAVMAPMIRFGLARLRYTPVSERPAV